MNLVTRQVTRDSVEILQPLRFDGYSVWVSHIHPVRVFEPDDLVGDPMPRNWI